MMDDRPKAVIQHALCDARAARWLLQISALCDDLRRVRVDHHTKAL